MPATFKGYYLGLTSKDKSAIDCTVTDDEEDGADEIEAGAALETNVILPTDSAVKARSRTACVQVSEE